MTIQLYEGCWVRTAGGSVIGPFHESKPWRFECQSVFVDGNGDPTQANIPEWHVVAVYLSLSAASQANPEL